MLYSLRGMAVTMVFVAGVSVYSLIDRSSNYAPATASVFLIDRTCDIVETTTSWDGKSSTRDTKGECSSVDEWDSVREKRSKTVSGTAVVHLSYTAPQDGSSHTAELKFTGRDDEFYRLKAGDELKVLVRNDDLDKVIKA